MPRIVPSTAVAVIDLLMKHNETGQMLPELGAQDDGIVQAILKVVEQIPDELLRFDTHTHAKFVRAVADLQVFLANTNPQKWILCEFSADITYGPHVLRESLAKLSDQVSVVSTDLLKCIADAALRESIQIDVSSVRASLHTGEWKAATVLAGSIIEALLLWAIQQIETKDPVRISTATTKAGKLLVSQGKKPKANWSKALVNWVLDDMLPIAEIENVIDQSTSEHADKAREFRNLIHPGRAQRLGQKCTRGTAHATVGAMELIIEALERWPGP